MRYPDEDFFFTAQSLSTFESCPLKFRYRYIEGIRWDEDDTDERSVFKAGREFHLAARRYFTGIDDGICPGRREDCDLQAWVNNLKAFFPPEAASIYKPEQKIRLMEEKLRLEANIDLLVIKDGKAVIWDWKTRSAGSRQKNDYSKSLQTMVYLYVVCRQTTYITGAGQDNTSVSMLYWQPEPPRTLCEITPDAEMIGNYGRILTEKVENIELYDWKSFNRAQYYKSCKNCEFARLCAG